MLTLGAEYRDTWWGPTTGDSHRLKERSEEELDTVTQTDTCSEDKNDGPTWREFHFSGNSEKYDTFLSLDGLSRVGQRDGVLQMIRKHENLNGTTWPCRWHTAFATLTLFSVLVFY